ncbi:putative oxidoreductase [Nocardia neocaledoniensis NBRC 108232]|uniref:Glycine/D-amino acid oxidase-like deaminating enzyme n=1 Tax=Nocardia neocaledoniensis TaxID=236511 RepID=A0A317N1M7_9NOCA|nr:FAD-dependent oxidoreductase [Nocardia neocaledoniensis]PWV67785.1 glycine/D-amino acid oxidase-like deaminating enzyme [Nocardia neocaledoniensis]GEM30995.1 putative oxidoreductase [Nocardia neocaledoniensis NBRC 108232]
MTETTETLAADGIEYSSFSGWIERPTDIAPAVEGEITADVVVVGGGYLGMGTALRLAERGVDVALLESEFCGWGAASRNAGYLTNTLAGDAQMHAAMHPRRLRRAVGFADRSVTYSDGLIDGLGIDCDYERTGNVIAAVTRGQLERSRWNARILTNAGADAEFVDGREFGLPAAFLGGIYERRGGIINPGKYARGLRSALMSSSARVFEHSPVGSIQPTSTGVTVTTASGTVRAKRVVIANNAHSRDLAITPRNLVAPLWVSLVETEPIDPERLRATGWTSRVGISTHHLCLESFRLTSRNTIIFGIRQAETARGALGARTPNPTVVADLVRGFRIRFPTLHDVAPQRAWGGWIGITTSWLPVVGEADRNVYYAVACNGHGLAQGPYLGSMLADRLCGDKAADDLEAVWRPRPRFAPSPAASSTAVRAAWRLDRFADYLDRRNR